MTYLVKILSVFIVSVTCLGGLGNGLAAGFPAPAFLGDPGNHGRDVQRTMRLLATSTPEEPNTVRILFYGQSITEQEWWRTVVLDLEKRFPSANIVARNLAIGGFPSQYLVNVTEWDVLSEYPDLVIFYVFGAHNRYEDILRFIRENTTAVILIQTDHLNSRGRLDEVTEPGELSPSNWSPWMNYVWLPKMAEKYGAGLVDQRNIWKAYLREHNLQPQALLRDGVHLNEHGNWLMAKIVSAYLKHRPDLPAPAEKWVTAQDFRWENGKIETGFEGNAVTLIVDRAGKVPDGGALKIFVDGKPPSEIPEIRRHTRTRYYPGTKWPCILEVNSEAPLVTQQWVLTLTEISDDHTFCRFKVEGSVTGLDGEGESDERFVSGSGQVVIDPDDWHLERGFKQRGQPLPKDFQITWETVPLGTDEVSKPGSHRVVRGLPNGRHTLRVESSGEFPLEWILIHKPPLEAKK